LNVENLTAAVRYARVHTRFYRESLPEFDIRTIEEFRRLPFTTAEDLRKHGGQLLAVPPGEIDRIITLGTSGTTGAVKRLFFTGEDIERTVEFFRKGMRRIVNAGGSVYILFTGATRELLRRGLARIPAETVDRPEEASCVVGLPSEVLSLPNVKLHSVLLSGEYVSEDIRTAIRDKHNCAIFEHYGLTESCLGFAVSCVPDIDFYHARSSDFYIEIIDPITGEALHEGMRGEIVFTTLGKRGMPLVRYRTGDISSLHAGRCPACGRESVRLSRVEDRGIIKGKS